jgi:putative oxidoreductase
MKTGSSIITRILNTENDKKLIIVRLIVGLIFISEGIQKFLFLEIFGPGFFQEIGFGHAFFWAYFTGACEILFGILMLIGLLTRIVSLPLLAVMMIAFITTKLPMLTTKGFWAFLHEYNTDFCLTMLLILLLIYGGGKWSVDLKILKSKNPPGFL